MALLRVVLEMTLMLPAESSSSTEGPPCVRAGAGFRGSILG